jgi:hypothetical protein
MGAPSRGRSRLAGRRASMCGGAGHVAGRAELVAAQLSAAAGWTPGKRVRGVRAARRTRRAGGSATRWRRAAAATWATAGTARSGASTCSWPTSPTTARRSGPPRRAAPARPAPPRPPCALAAARRQQRAASGCQDSAGLCWLCSCCAGRRWAAHARTSVHATGVFAWVGKHARCLSCLSAGVMQSTLQSRLLDR